MKRTIRYGLINGFGRLKKRRFGLTGISSFFASFVDNRIGSSKPHEKVSAFIGPCGIYDTSITPQKRHDTSKRDGNHRWEKITNGLWTKSFDAETELTRGSHVEEEAKRSDKIVGRTKNENAFISP